MTKENWQNLFRYFTTYGEKYPNGLTVTGNRFLKHGDYSVLYGNMDKNILVQYFIETEWTEASIGTLAEFEADVSDKVR